MNKFKIILDSSVIFSISNKDIAALKQYQIYITPTNMFEIFTHSEANKIKNPKEFIIAKLKLYQDLEAKFLPARKELIQEEFAYNTGSYTKRNKSSRYFAQMQAQILEDPAKIHSSNFCRLCIKEPLNETQKFAQSIETARKQLKNYCIDPQFCHERQKYFSKQKLDYNKERLRAFDSLPIDINQFITNLLDKDISKEQISKFKKSFFISNLFECWKKLLRKIIETDRKAEKGDYFDFEFLMYVCSQTHPIDFFLTNNIRDFQNILSDSKDISKKIMEWKKFKCIDNKGSIHSTAIY